jgi:hypothetical protein
MVNLFFGVLIAVIVAGAVIMLGPTFGIGNSVGTYQLISNGSQGVWRLNTATGRVSICATGCFALPEQGLD